MADVVVGHFAVFDSPASIAGEFLEILRPGAFDRTLRHDDPRALWNHDTNLTLGRQSARTLRLSTDKTGLVGEIVMPEWAAGHYETVQRGDVSGASFGFLVPDGGDVWRLDDEGHVVREIFAVRLYEVSPTPFPAYTSTAIATKTRSTMNTQQRKIATALRLAR